MSGGELSPELDARSDLQKYYSGCLIMKNMIPRTEGGGQSRPGMYFMAPTKYPDKKARMISFDFSTIQAYELEFGDEYIRFFKDKGQIQIYTVWTAGESYAVGCFVKHTTYFECITANSDATWTAGKWSDTSWANGVVYARGDYVTHTGIIYYCDIAHTAGTFATDVANGKFIAQTAYEIPTTYLEADLFKLKVTQSADVMYIAHCDYAPSKLTRSGHTSWTLTEIDFLPPPTAVQNFYPVATLTLGAVTGTSVLCTASNPIFLGGDVKRQIISGAGKGSITSVVSTTQVRIDITSDFLSVGPIAANLWAIYGPFSSSLTPDIIEPTDAIVTLTSSGGTETRISLVSAGVLKWTASGSGTDEYFCELDAGGDPSITLPDKCYENDVEMYNGAIGTLGLCQWAYGDNDALGFDTVYARLSDGTDPTTKADSYVESAAVVAAASLFRSGDVGSYIRINEGFVKITSFTSVTVVKGIILKKLSVITAAVYWTLETPVWDATLGYPGAVVFFEQCLGWGGSKTYPYKVWLSVSEDYENHLSDPTASDAALTYPLVSDKVDAIRWMIGENVLILGTTGGVWKLGATSASDPLTQDNISAKLQKAVGVKDIDAEMVDDAVIFIQRGGTTLRRILYSFQVDKYVAQDLTRLTKHIAKGDSLANSGFMDIDFQSEPFSIIWCPRADGQMPGMTYESDENIFAWFRVVTNGKIESVCVTGQDGEEDVVTISVKRTIGGTDYRYVEYFMPHEIYGQIEDAFCVDSGLTWNGGASVDITGISQAATAIVTAVGHTFTAGMQVRIKDVVGMTQANQSPAHAYTVGTVAGNTFELSGIDSTGWDAYESGGTAQQVAISVTGLSHLIGETVAIWTNEGKHPARVVSASGGVTMAFYANKIHVGLPYTCDIMPMKIEPGTGQGSSRTNKKRIFGLTVSFYRTYGAQWGVDEDNLQDVPFGIGIVPALFSGEIQTDFDMDFSNSATILIRQAQPCPMTVLSISPKMEVTND